MTVTLANCEAWAEGTTPLPPTGDCMPAPTESSYRTYGTYTQYGSGGTSQATTRANDGFASSFASGYNAVSAIGEAIALAIQQQKVRERTAACMHQAGWFDVTTPEDKEALQKATEMLDSQHAETPVQEGLKQVE